MYPLDLDKLAHLNALLWVYERSPGYRRALGALDDHPKLGTTNTDNWQHSGLTKPTG